MDSFSSEDPRDTETSTSASTLDVGFLPLVVGPDSSAEQGALDEPPPPGLLPEIGDLAGGPWVEQPGWRNLGFGSPLMPGGSLLHHHLVSETHRGQEEAETGDTEDKPQAVLEGPVQEVLDLLGTLEPAQPQLRELQKQVLGLRERCKVGPCLCLAGRCPCFAGSLPPAPCDPRGPQITCLDSSAWHWAGREVTEGSQDTQQASCSRSGQNRGPAQGF